MSVLGDLFYRAKGSVPAAYVSVAWDHLRASRFLSSDPEGRFIIFCQGRSGSTLLTALLNNSVRIRCDGEVLGDGLRIRLRDPLGYLEARSRAKNGRAIYGCKIKIYDLTGLQGLRFSEAKALVRRLAREGWRIVHLRRKDWFRQALSGILAEHRQLYHDRGTVEVDRSPVTVEVPDLMRRMELLERFTAQEEEVLETIEHHRLVYEADLLREADHQRTLDGVLDYLGVPRAPASSIYRRTGSDDPEHDVANWSAVRGGLCGTRFEDFLSFDESRTGPPTAPTRDVE